MNDFDVRIVSNERVAEDFPDEFEKCIWGRSLSDGFHIYVTNEEVLDEDLFNDKIDYVLGKTGLFRRYACEHNGVLLGQGEFYFINRWDAEQVKKRIENRIEEMLKENGR